MIFDFDDGRAIGEVRSVDTTQLLVDISGPEELTRTRVGRLVAVQGSDANEWLVGIVDRIWRDQAQTPESLEGQNLPVEVNSIQVTLLGTYQAKHGLQEDYFTRALLSLPDINRPVFPIEEKALEGFMGIIGTSGSDGVPLEIGTYSLDRRAKAYLNANRLFQRHVAVLGSTGSGKSWTVASVLEQAARLKSPNVVLFDLHGEYRDLPYACSLRIAGPKDLDRKDDAALFLPFWLMNFEEVQALLIDYSEQSAPNQASVVLELITAAKRKTLESLDKQDILSSFTVDSPVPFDFEGLVASLDGLNKEEIDTGEVYASGDKKGQPKTRQGPLHDKLTRMLIRLKNRAADRRYGFMFRAPKEWYEYATLDRITAALLGYSGLEEYDRSGIKVVDFSEVPSDVLPVIVSLVARLVFQVQFWTDPGEDNTQRNPVLMVCDEAHLYLPNDLERVSPPERRSVESFQRIAKEGRKYGVGLMVVSQRPSDVNTTILSQCNNIIALRLTNERDKSAVRNMLPDTLGGLLGVLPGLEVGEAIVVGDATLLPTRIFLNPPQHKPKSMTMDFWTNWAKTDRKASFSETLDNLRRQGRKLS